MTRAVSFCLQSFLRRLGGFIAVCFLAAMMAPLAASGEMPSAITEYEVKAAFLYKFTLFIDWPKSAFNSKDDPFVIAVLGEDPFEKELDKIAASETVKGRKIVIARAEKGAAVPFCHILFISSSERKRLAEVLESVRDRPILTVSEIEDFCGQGGGIRFAQENKKVKLRINPQAAKTARLRVRSELLAIAKIVRTAKP
jgi:hypothetical protein